MTHANRTTFVQAAQSLQSRFLRHSVWALATPHWSAAT